MAILNIYIHYIHIFNLSMKCFIDLPRHTFSNFHFTFRHYLLFIVYNYYDWDSVYSFIFSIIGLKVWLNVIWIGISNPPLVSVTLDTVYWQQYPWQNHLPTKSNRETAIVRGEYDQL